MAEEFRVAQNIMIKRSSGQTHPAMISAINEGAKTCTVEWFEKGETKDKEVDFDTIRSLNPSVGGKAAKEASPTAAQRNGRHKPAASPEKPERKTMSGSKNSGLSLRAAVMVRGKENWAPADKQNNNCWDTHQWPNQTPEGIDRIAKGREERRRKAEEAKAVRSYAAAKDAPSPNWAFQEMVLDYKDSLEVRPLVASDDVLDHRICVAVRKRPMSKKELGRKEVDVVTIPLKDTVIIHQPQTKVDLTKYLENQKFRFDYTFDENTDNAMVYRFTAQPLVRTVFEEGMATCFAYGQTGSGKTHTMGGDFSGKSQDCSKGIYALTARDIFRLKQSKDYRDRDLLVSCSFFELYGQKVFDLLGNRAKLRILEDGKKEVNIVGLQEIPVHSEQDVLDLIAKGTGERTSGQTHANSNSSRSHAVFQIVLRKRHPRGLMGKLHGKFSLIDLAGNERGADTMNWGGERQARVEAAEINTSLLSLKECIHAMGKKSAHIPFRGSKLTLALRDSFVGEKSRTCMITMVSPGMNSCEHSLNSLRYSDRVKELGAEEEAELARRLHQQPGLEAEEAEEEDDLALLHCRNVQDFPDEMLRFDAAINWYGLGAAEERVVEAAPNVFRATKNRTAQTLQTLRKELDGMEKAHGQTRKADYDVKAYAANLKRHLAQVQSSVAWLQGEVESLSVELSKEAELAQQAKESKSRSKRKK